VEPVGEKKDITMVIIAKDGEGLQPVFGTPNVRRLALLARQLGFKAVHVIGQAEPLRPVLTDLIPADAFHPVKDPVLLDRIIGTMPLPPHGQVLVLKANHVIDRHSVDRLIEKRSPTGLRYMAPGKNLEQAVYLSDRSGLLPILRGLWAGDLTPVGGWDRAFKIEAAEGMPHLMLTGKGETALSESKLIASLSSQTEAEDGFMARHFDRFISRSISNRLARTRISPNQITLGGVAIGFSGAFLLSRPGYWPQLAGALLFLFCVIIDGVDGEVARLKLMESRFGHYLDVVTDNIVHVLVFIGIAFGLYHHTGDPIYMQALGFLMGGFLLCVIAVYQCVLRRSPDELRQASRLLRFMSLLTNRDFAYLVVFLALVHRLNWFLMGSAAGAYVFALTLWAMRYYENRAMAHKAP
jgi:phosphatidylglycerophosphate synthase